MSLGDGNLNKYLDVPYGAETKAFRAIPGNFVLSPSGVGKFYDNPAEWWSDRNGVITFDGNTNTVLGNAVHAAIDQYWDIGTIPTEEEVKDWIETRYARQILEIVEVYGKKKFKVDPDEVLKHYASMVNVFINEYASIYPKPDKREFSINTELQENIIIAGTLDGFEEDRGVVIDYKTTGKKPSEMSKGHKYQMATYAFAMIAKGYNVETLRVVYIQKQTKTLPPRLHIFEEEVTDELLFEVMRIQENMKKSINVVGEHPEYEDIIFRDNPLSMWS